MRRLLTVAVVMVTVLGVLGVSLAAAQETEERSWLAMGDSYSSGEGIPGTVPVGQDGVNGGPNGQGQNRDCRRATGEGTDATAWAVGAFELVPEDKGLEHLDFVACTGATLDEAAGQIGEASEATGRDQWDLVTFSFGGNNIGFEDVIYDCLGIGSTWGTFDGCDISERQLRRRVDMLTGQTDIGGGYQGSLTLPALLDLLAANQVVPGGDVIVVGYPHLIEEVDRWDRWRRDVVRNCEGIKRRDVAMLRSVNGYLNEQIALAVWGADQRHRADGVRFHFLDISQDPYEYGNADHRHGLCSRDPWLNGFTTGIGAGDLDIRLDSQFHNSFHPNQTGHTNTAEVLAAFLRGNTVRFDDAPEPVIANSSGIAGVELFAPAGSLLNDLIQVLGAPDADSGFAEIACLPGDPARRRDVRWGALTVTVETDPSRWPEPVLASWLIDFAEADAPDEVEVEPAIGPETTWEELSGLGARWDDFYGSWELSGLFGVLTSSVPDPQGTVDAFGAGSTGLLGC